MKNFRPNFSRQKVRDKFPKANIILLALTVIIVFIIPAFPNHQMIYLNHILIIGLFLSAVSTLKKNQNLLIALSFILPIGVLIGKLNEMELFANLLRMAQFFFFLFLVGSLILRVSKISSVTLEVIIDSVVGYLLLGFAFTLIVTIVSVWIPDAYNVSFTYSGKTVLENNIYYTFITFTTAGYGDILPTHPISKSLATLISVSGQLYLAIIIAMLVGKYASIGKPNL